MQSAWWSNGFIELAAHLNTNGKRYRMKALVALSAVAFSGLTAWAAPPKSNYVVLDRVVHYDFEPVVKNDTGTIGFLTLVAYNTERLEVSPWIDSHAAAIEGRHSYDVVQPNELNFKACDFVSSTRAPPDDRCRLAMNPVVDGCRHIHRMDC